MVQIAIHWLQLTHWNEFAELHIAHTYEHTYKTEQEEKKIGCILFDFQCMMF